MNIEKLVKFIVSFFIVVQVLGFMFRNYFLSTYSNLVLLILMPILYVLGTKTIRFIHSGILLLFIGSEVWGLINPEDYVIAKIIFRIIIFVVLFYFLYNNHKSFVYNKRDVFTLTLGTLLYTVIFFLAYGVIKTSMQHNSILIFFHMLLLYILLVVGAMHYINIRSEKSLWFFLSMLNFAFADYMWLLDLFYIESYELKVLQLICEPMAVVFLVNYMVGRSIKLKSEEFEGF